MGFVGLEGALAEREAIVDGRRVCLVVEERFHEVRADQIRALEVWEASRVV
jgi:hypothetical protein